jgi:hypothetical protein
MLTGPCALTTLGAAIIAAPAMAAPLRNLRRDGLLLVSVCFIFSSRSMGCLALMGEMRKRVLQLFARIPLTIFYFSF